MRDKSLTEEIAVSDNDIENNAWAAFIGISLRVFNTIAHE